MSPRLPPKFEPPRKFGYPNEEDAFASVLTLKKNYMVMVICEILILLLYCGFYITIVRRISKKSDELNEDLNVSNTLIQCVRKWVLIL